jgi:tRNA A-37 threonylcarbamoyl transferase component Bud32
MINKKKLYITNSSFREVSFSKKWKRIGNGAYATYYKISPRRGIKIFAYTYKHVHIEEVIPAAYQEFKLLKAACKSGHSPKPYEIVVVKGLGQDHIGIVMQHIDGKRVSDLKWEVTSAFQKKIRLSIEDFLRDMMRTCNVYHGDLHTGNMIAKVKKGKISKVYAVDFSPCSSGFINR